MRKFKLSLSNSCVCPDLALGSVLLNRDAIHYRLCATGVGLAVKTSNSDEFFLLCPFSQLGKESFHNLEML